MIEAAMMFALGALVAGLFALGLIVALVRRTRRITERRLKASLSTRRGDFDAERGEARARHALEVRRLERELTALRDRATAYRLEADLKDPELIAARAELDAHRVTAEALAGELAAARAALAETGAQLAANAAALEAAYQGMAGEVERRRQAEAALGETRRFAEERQLEGQALVNANELLRARLNSVQARFAEGTGPMPVDANRYGAAPFGALPMPDFTRALPSPMPVLPAGSANGRAPSPPPDVQDGERTPESRHVERIAKEISRIAGEAAAHLPRGGRAGSAQPQTLLPAPNGAAPASSSANGAGAPPETKSGPPKADVVAAFRRPADGKDKGAERRLLEALEELRSLKAAGGGRPPAE